MTESEGRRSSGLDRRVLLTSLVSVPVAASPALAFTRDDTLSAPDAAAAHVSRSYTALDARDWQGFRAFFASDANVTVFAQESSGPDGIVDRYRRLLSHTIDFRSQLILAEVVPAADATYTVRTQWSVIVTRSAIPGISSPTLVGSCWVSDRVVTAPMLLILSRVTSSESFAPYPW